MSAVNAHANGLVVHRIGLITAVGGSAPSTCAALRAKISNPSETRFTDSRGKWVTGHQVELERPWRGVNKLARMAVLAIEEAMQPMPRAQWGRVPMLLCVAEPDRPGRIEGMDVALAVQIQDLLGIRFDEYHSAVVTHGRVAPAVALDLARRLIVNRECARVLLVAADSLLARHTLAAYERDSRLLADSNSNGFMPGEAAGAMLLGGLDSADTRHEQLWIVGLGFAREQAHIASDRPLRADGLTAAIQAALYEAEIAMHDIDFRITDLSGENYYFKEASLALSRTLRGRKEHFDLWHPAECIGDVGAASGVAILAVAEAACAKGYSLGPHILAHWSNDNGHRAAAVLCWQQAGTEEQT